MNSYYREYETFAARLREAAREAIRGPKTLTHLGLDVSYSHYRKWMKGLSELTSSHFYVLARNLGLLGEPKDEAAVDLTQFPLDMLIGVRADLDPLQRRLILRILKQDYRGVLRVLASMAILPNARQGRSKPRPQQ